MSSNNLHEAGDPPDACHVMHFMWARPVTWQQMKGYPQLLLSLPRIFCEGEYRETISLGGRKIIIIKIIIIITIITIIIIVIIIIIIIIIIIDHVTMLTC